MIRDFLKSSGIILIADLGSKLFGFALISALTYFLVPDDLGRYNALMTAATSLCAISGLGIPIILQRRSALSAMYSRTLGHDIVAGLLTMLVCMILLLAAGAFMSANLSKGFFSQIDPWLLGYVLLITLGYFLVQSPLSILLGIGKFRLYSSRTLVESISTGILVATGAISMGLKGAILGLLASLILNAGIVFILMHKVFRKENIRLNVRVQWSRVAAMVKEGAPYFIGNTLIGSLANFVMIALFIRHIGYTELGFIRVALSLATILAIIPNAIKTVTITYVASMRESSLKLRSLQVRYLFFFMMVSTICLVLVLKPIVILLFGEEYTKGMDVYILMLYVYVPLNLHAVLNTFIVGEGHLIYSGFVTFSLTMLFITLMFCLIPHLKTDGYFVAFGLSYLCGAVFLAAGELLRHAYPDKERILVALLLTSAFLAMCIFMHSHDLFINYHIHIQIVLLLCYIAIHWFWIFAPEERTRFFLLLKEVKLAR